MTDYTKTTNFAAKDNLVSGNPAKVVKGSEIDTEYNNIAIAVATKSNIASPTFTGTVTIPTVDINAGNIDGTVIGASSAAAGTFTSLTTSSNVTVGGNLTVTGNAVINGNLTFGDAATDTVAFGADVNSHFIPDIDNTYDLGSSTQEWRNLYIDGTANIDSLVADTADINGGTLDGVVIGGSSAAAGTFTTATATTGNITTLNSTTVDTTSLEVTNLKAKDGTSAGSIADTTGVVTIASSVLTTTDINGGSIDGAIIGGSSAAAITGTTVNGTVGTFTTSAVINSDMTITAGSILSASGSITFGNENLVTTGTFGSGAATLGATTVTTLGGTGALSGFTTGAFSSTLTSGTHTISSDLTLAAGSITSASGAISFGNENLTTTGTASTGAITSSSTIRATSSGVAISNTTSNYGGFTSVGVRGIAQSAPGLGGQFICDSSGRCVAFSTTDDNGSTAGSQLRINFSAATGNNATINLVAYGNGSASGYTDLKYTGLTHTFATGTGAATNLTLSGASGSQLATFAGDVTLSDGRLSITDTANETALQITSSSTSSDVLDIASSTVTTGKLFDAVDNSTNTGTRTVGRFLVNQAAATGATALTLTNNSTGNALSVTAGDVTLSNGKVSITDTANENALTVTSSTTTNAAIGVTANSLETGYIFYGYSNGGDASTRTLQYLHNDNAAASGTTISTLIQDADQRAMFVDMNGNAVAEVIDSEATTAAVATWNAPTSAYLGILTNEHATTPMGLHIDFSAATPNDTTQMFAYFEDATALRFSVRSNGGIANFQSNDADLSDQRVKTELTPLESYWNKIKALEIGTYRYLDSTNDRTNIGVIAQTTQAIAPEFVSEGFGDDDLLTVHNKDLYFASIHVLQEAMARIEELEKKIHELTS